MAEERIQGIGRDDFIFVEEGEDAKVRTIRGGRGRVSPAPGESRNSTRERHLEPEIVCGPDGRLGWRISLPGARPVSTPAVVNGKVFVGGGFGSHEFYAFDAATGRLLWQLKTGDDGPTAATVAGEYVAFNTESCTVYVVDATSGRVVWEKWLGDPLMAQTAICDSTLFMAYPDKRMRHQLAAFDLTTGKVSWQTELVADVITAPIVVDDGVYAASHDGTVYRIDRDTGKVHWSINHSATSAPWVHRGRLFMSLRENDEVRGKHYSTEGYDTVTVMGGHRRTAKSSSRRKAEYLEYRAEKHRPQALQDALVGFASAPEAAKLHYAAGHLGFGHVSSAWGYEGSRPEVFDDGIFGSLDDVAQRLDLATKKPVWRVRVETGETDNPCRALNPPAVTSSRLYITSYAGDLFVLDRETGEERWALNLGSAIVSQPALGEGKVFLGTANGALCAFEVDDNDPRGWPMWGGGPGHNGAP